MIWTISRQFRPCCTIASPCCWLRNTGKKFVDVSAISGDVFQEAWVGRGMAIGDIDNDGRIDAVVTTNGGPAHILLNKTATANHWITLHLTGHKSNRDGIGAVVKLTTAKGSQWVTVTTSSGYLSASDPRVHFGMGESAVGRHIEIRWPSGIGSDDERSRATSKWRWTNRPLRRLLETLQKRFSTELDCHRTWSFF